MEMRVEETEDGTRLTRVNVEADRLRESESLCNNCIKLLRCDEAFILGCLLEYFTMRAIVTACPRFENKN